MKPFETYDKYYVAFTIGEIDASTEWTRDVQNLRSTVEELESDEHDVEIRYIVAGSEKGMSTSTTRFVLDELREPAL